MMESVDVGFRHEEEVQREVQLVSCLMSVGYRENIGQERLEVMEDDLVFAWL